jgi:hypothetical protein
MKTSSGGLVGALILKIGALFSLMILFPGCVEFDGQTLTYRYDRENDRLLCFQVYENIHSDHMMSPYVTPQDEFPSAGMEERIQLISVMTGQRTFFFANWVTEYDREDYVKEKEKAKKDLLVADLNERQVLESLLALIDLILDNVEVKNGNFYLNDRHQLCGYQYVTISKASEIVAGINKLYAISYLSEDFNKSDEFDEFDEADRIRLKESIERGEWIQMEGNQFRIRWVSKDDVSQKCADDDTLCVRGDNIHAEYNKPLMELTVGRKNDTITRLAAPPSSQVKDDLIEYVSHTFGIKKLVPIDRLRDEFIRTGEIPE